MARLIVFGLVLVLIASVFALFSSVLIVRILGGVVLGLFLYVFGMILWPIIKMSPRLLSATLSMNGLFFLDSVLCKLMLSFWQNWNALAQKFGFAIEHDELRGWYSQIASNSIMHGDFQRACTMYRLCLDIAMNEGTIADVGEARVNLAYILLKVGDIEESSQLMKRGLADVEREYNRLVREFSEAEDEFARNKDSEESYVYEAGASAAKFDLEQIKIRFYTCLYSYGDFLETLFQYKEAVTARQRAFEVALECFPEDEKGLEYVLTQLGICQAKVESFEEASQNLKRGFSIREKFYEKNSSAYSHGLFSLGLLKHLEGDLEEAEKLMDEHLKIYYALPKVYRIDEGYYLAYHGALKRDLGKYDQAKELLEKSIALKKALYDTEHPDLVESYIEYEKLLRLTDETAKADEMLEKVITLQNEAKKRAGLE